MTNRPLYLLLVIALLVTSCDVRREPILGCQRVAPDGKWLCHINIEEGVELYECPPDFDPEEIDIYGSTIIEQCLKIQPESDTAKYR